MVAGKGKRKVSPRRHPKMPTSVVEICHLPRRHFSPHNLRTKLLQTSPVRKMLSFLPKLKTMIWRRELARIWPDCIKIDFVLNRLVFCNIFRYHFTSMTSLNARTICPSSGATLERTMPVTSRPAVTESTGVITLSMS